MVFGQGALRCSPWASRLLTAAAAGRAGPLLRALVGQVGHLLAAGWAGG